MIIITRLRLVNILQFCHVMKFDVVKDRVNVNILGDMEGNTNKVKFNAKRSILNDISDS